ncbi:uncharacterized protein ppk17 [Dermacentor andersoni]|uniref:uncharacterized protein ppk17 n=1 Tax=Dermacentor andersoni TaxID=34620 RepID=UPI003B3A4D66
MRRVYSVFQVNQHFSNRMAFTSFLFYSCRRPPARLVLYFNSLTYEHILSVPKYDETHVLGNLGGIIGMYLGLSFFVLFQVLDILVVGTLRLRTMFHRDSRERHLVALAPPPARGQARTSLHTY